MSSVTPNRLEILVGSHFIDVLVSEQEVRSRLLITSDGSDLTVRLLGSHGGEVMKKED
jgi:hypothetical protein